MNKLTILAFLTLPLFSQQSITNNKVTADTIRGMVDSLYLKGDISINGKRAVNQYDTDTSYAAIGLTAVISGNGYQVTIKDSDGTGLLYKVESDGTDWFYVVMTKTL